MGTPSKTILYGGGRGGGKSELPRRLTEMKKGLRNVQRTTQHRIDEVEEAAAYERALEEGCDDPRDMWETGKYW